MWTKRPTYEEVLQVISKDYVRKLPDRVALQFYDSFAMTQFREQQAAINAHASNADQYRDEAMRQAAAETGEGGGGVTKHEFMQFAQQLNSQSQDVNRQLQQGLQQSAQEHQRGLQRQAEEFGRQMVEERIRSDQRSEFVAKQIAELAKTRDIPQVPTPKVPGTEEIKKAAQETANQIRGDSAGMFAQFSQGLAQQLGEAIRGMHGQSDKNMQNMLQMLFQQEERQRQRSDAQIAALASSQQPPPPPPGAGAIRQATSITPGTRPAGSSSDPPPGPSFDPKTLTSFAKTLMQQIKTGTSAQELIAERLGKAPPPEF